MSLDSKNKRGSAIHLGSPDRQWLAEPDGSLASTDRASLLKLAAAIAPQLAADVGASLAWRFHPPDFARTLPPKVAVGTFLLQPTFPEAVSTGVSLDKWFARTPDFARTHPPRIPGGMSPLEPLRPQPNTVPTLEMWIGEGTPFARTHRPLVRTGYEVLEPIRPQPDTVPTVQMWRGDHPDFAKGHPPRPHGGMSAPEPIRPPPMPDAWMFHQPDFAGRKWPRMVDTGLYATDTVTPPDSAPELSWNPTYPDLIWRAVPVRGMGGAAPADPSEVFTVDKWINYLPAMVPKGPLFASARAWYHPAYQAPFTVDDFVHTDHMHAAWFMVPSISGKFGAKPSIEANFDMQASVSGTQGVNP